MNEKLCQRLACPVTQQPLEWDKANNRLINRAANLAYPIVNGIPVLLPESGEPLDTTPFHSQ